MYKIFKNNFFLVLLLFSSACSQTIYFHKPETTDQQYYKDKSECQAFANIGQNRTSGEQIYYSGDNSIIESYNTATAIMGESSDRNELFFDCMRGRGYKVSYNEQHENSSDEITSGPKKHEKESYNNNDAWIKFKRGMMYYNGDGVNKNYQKAASWLKEAAELGHAGAQFKLGAMYYQGGGVEQNYKEAASWIEKSADQGFSLAQAFLGIMYLEGSGIEKDYQKAAKWLRLASQQGNKTAKKQLDLLCKKDSLACE